MKLLKKKLEPLAKKNDNFSNNYNKKFSEDQPIRNNPNNNTNNNYINNHNNNNIGNSTFLAQFDNNYDNDLTPLNTNLELNLITNDEPDYVVNSNGRLTEMKSVKTSNNIHDYLYSLSKKENEGYVEKYKDDQHRRTIEARKKKYQLNDYKKFTEDGNKTDQNLFKKSLYCKDYFF